jgi:hypothetical protein
MQICHITQGMRILTESSKVQMMYAKAMETIMVGEENEECHAVVQNHGILIVSSSAGY